MSGNKTTFLDVYTGDIAHRIACRKVIGDGDGRPGLLWLSGFNSAMSGNKASSLALWAEGRGLEMTLFDYSGHGESSGRFEDGTISLWLSQANAVLDRQTSGPQVLVGSSMGGWIALLMAREINARTPGRVAGLVLIAPAWDMTERLMWQTAPPDVRAIIQEQGVWHRPSAYGDESYPITSQLIEDGRKHLFDNAAIESGCPVRIVHGLEDPDVPWQGSETLVRNLTSSDVQLTLVKGAGHRLSEPRDIRLLKTLISDLIEPAI